MLRIMLSGASGAMGHVLAQIIENDPKCTVVCGYDRDAVDADFPVFTDLEDCNVAADVIIDFSHFSAFPKIFGYALKTKTPIVLATTGLSEEDMAHIKEGATTLPVFKTANMSLGINVLARALKELAGTLESGFDIEIIEKHHNKKVDAPSGTALLLADAVNAGLQEKKEYTYGRQGLDCKRQPGEMGIHAIRGGTIPGEHTVIFAGNDEIIELKHTALSKKVFANGAVEAAKFLVGQGPGLYSMDDVLA